MSNLKKILEVKNITKMYKVYNSNFDRLKEIFFKKSYHKEFISNNDISFDLFERETLGIIGVNGAGKSTILKMIAGVITPTFGKIIKRGRVTALLELGTGFNNEMSGYDNIYLNGTLIGMTKKEVDNNLQKIIDFSELDEYIYQNIKTYSSGMKMRLAFSIAIHSKPKILIVDEALSVGDAHFQAKCTKALAKRKKENMSIVYVSHSLNSIKLLCDRAILLHKGEVLKTGTPEDVINQYNFLIAKLNDKKERLKINQTNKYSFGTFDIEIIDIKILKKDIKYESFTSGDFVDIELLLYSKIDIDDVTIGIHIRDKFAQDIYGTNTFYQNKKITLKANCNYSCRYSMRLNIGAGKYTLGAAIHTQDWHTDLCYHWMDNALNFTVTPEKKNFSIGLCRLEPTIEINEIKS